MIDTLTCSHMLPKPSDTELEHLREHFQITSYTNAAGTFIKGTHNPPRDHGTLPRLTITAAPYHEGLRATAEVSLPKLVNGTNVTELTAAEVQDGLEMVTDYASKTLGREFDANTAPVSRVDYCAAWQVGEQNIKPFIEAASHARPSRMTAVTHGDTTAGFHNNSREIVLYSKHADVMRFKDASTSDKELSRGVLRLEHRYRTKAINALMKKLGVADRTPRSIVTPQASEYVIGHTMKALGIDNTITSRDERLETLRRVKDKDAATMYGALVYREQYGDDFWKLLDWSRAKFYRVRRDLQDAGLWLSSATPRSLPELRPALRLVTREKAA